MLAYLIARPAANTQELSRQARSDALRHMMQENPQGMHAALGAIAQTLAGYARACLNNGASGIFFAIVRMARAGVMSREAYATFGTPYDTQVLAAVQGAPFNMLHLCGEDAYFDLVADYPVHAINWASIDQRNPGLAEAQHQTSMAVVGGIDETGVLQHGSPEEVISAAQLALQATSGHKVLLAPGCTTAMNVPIANLHALRRAAEPRQT
ncbi:MAG: hypothetical protein HC914_21105 [Chloroflexaceae bacterium]|nr:hypothetical protein [Chloroflexaceae bacterium]